MREIYKTYSLKGKKQIKTTTFAVALLVAATLIFSSALPVMATKDNSMKMNVIKTEESFSITLADPNGPQGLPIIDVASSSQQNNPKPLDIWDTQFFYETGQQSLYLVGVVFDGEYFYQCDYWQNNWYYWDIEGNYMGSFTMSGLGTGIIDMCFDGEYAWGAAYSGYTLYQFDLENQEVIDTISLPLGTYNVAYDSDDDAFWIGQWSYHLTKIDKDGNIIDEIPVPESMLGITYDNTFEYSPYNGPFLWIHTGTSSYPSTPAVIKCIDIDSKELIPDFEHDVTEDFGGGIAGGLSLTYLWDSSISVLMGCVQGVANDYIFGYEASLLIPPEHDVGVRQIITPQDGPGSADIIPEVLVKNYGNNSENTNVQFEIIKCEAGPPLLSENFSGSFPPTGWTTDYWQQVNSQNAGGEPPEARVYKYTQYYAGDYYYNHIMSPQVNCTGFEKVNVRFRMAIDVYYLNYVYFYLKYRANSTASWKDVTPWDNPIPADIESTHYEIGCYGWGEDIGSEFQLKFEMTSYYYYFNYVWLDDIEIEGCAGCAEYADLAEYIDIPVGEEVVVDDFEPWTPSEWQNPEYQDTWEEYPITTYTILNENEDENSRNDKRTKLLNLYYPWLHDIGTFSLEGPESGPAQSFPIEAMIKNVGQYDECCFKAHAQVAELNMETSEELLTEDFYPYDYSGFPPNGWTRTNTKWRAWPYNWAGGTYPEACFYWSPSETGTFRLYTPPIDTTGFGAVQIDWQNYVNHYSGPYTLKVETSPDSVSWTTVWEVVNPSSMPAEAMSVTTGENVGSSTFYVSYTFDGYSYNINYWCIDDVVISGFPLAEPEYTDEVCISDIDQGEELFLEFEDWTPEFFSEELSGTKLYSVKVWADLQDPEDNDHANDAFGKFVELEFFHDVGIKEVTSPFGSATQVEWIQYSDETIENALGLTSAPNTITEAIKLTPDELGAYTNHEITRIRVCKGYPGYNYIHDYVVWMYTGAQPTSPDDGTVVATGTSPQSYGWFEIDTDDYGFKPTDNVWVGVNWDHWATSTFPISLDNSIYIAGKSSWLNYNLGSGWVGWSEYPPYSMMLGAGVEKAGANVYVPMGTSAIEAIAENIGTFPERDMTCYADIYEFYTDCENATLVYEDEITGIEILQPLGGTKTLMFEDYNFEVEGPYELQLELVDDNDDDLSNNLALWGIGCDDTPPSTTAELDPPEPDGLEDWYVSDVEITVTATDPTIGCDWDGSGVKEIRYQIDNEPEEIIPGDFGTFVVITDSTMHTIKYWAIDNVGNAETKHTINFKQDQTPPEVEISYEVTGSSPSWDILVTVNATDATAGMVYVEFWLNDVLQATVTGGGPTYEWSFKYGGGLNIFVTGTGYDEAGHFTSDTVKIVHAKPYSSQQHSSSSRAQPLPR